jgi:hypothetical protein
MSSLCDAQILAPTFYEKINIGQFKIPMSAEALSPVTKQDLINKYRFLTQLLPTSYRDIGVMAEGNIFTGKISYQSGIFNGNGLNNKTNDDDQYFYVGRLMTKEAFLQMGISAASSRETGTGNSAIESAFGSPPYRKNLAQADLKIGKKNSFLKGEFIFGRYNFDSAKTIRASGFGFTVGKFLMLDKLSIIARYEEYNPDRSIINRKDTNWTTVGLNYFPANKVKLQANYVFKREAKSEKRNDTFAVQLQYCFK